MTLTKKQKELRSAILDKIYGKRPISRIDISKETGITPATVSTLTGEMITQNLLLELGETDEQNNKAGRKKILLDIKHHHSFYVGAEVAEDFISFVLTDNIGEILKEQTIDISQKNFNYTSNSFIQLLHSFTKSIKQPISALGIAIPGHYSKDYPDKILTNNKRWQLFDLSDISKSVSFPVFFANNVNCMALSERLFQRHNDDNFALLHIGRGLHCSYMYHGDIFSKENLLIGEIGHTIVAADGELCECGKRGCLQTYASESWLIKKSKILFRNSANTYLKQLVTSEDEISIKIILDTYELGDVGIMSIVNSAIQYLAISLINLNMMIDSKQIVVHGKLFEKDSLHRTLKELVETEPKLMFLPHQEIVLKPYSIYNGAIGGCALCIQQLWLQ